MGVTNSISTIKDGDSTFVQLPVIVKSTLVAFTVTKFLNLFTLVPRKFACKKV